MSRMSRKAGGRLPGMPDQLLTFVWPVPAAGYRWEDTAPVSDVSQRGRFLTDGVPIGQLQDLTYYAPLQSEPALFKTFANLEPTEDGILEFANKYGDLGAATETIILGNSLGRGERIDLWTREVEAMREAVNLREAAMRGDLAYLRTRIVWDEDGKRVRYQAPGGRGGSVIAMKTDLPDRFNTRMGNLIPGDPVLPALLYVQEQVNERLAAHAAARLLWGDRWLRGKRKSWFHLHVVPKNLLGAMWLQLAAAVEGKREYRQCAAPGCNRWFELKPDTNRPDKIYCSDACKSRAWRAREKDRRERKAEKGGDMNADED